MKNKISNIITSLSEDTIQNIAINNDEQIVDVVFVDRDEQSHVVQFSSVDTYFFLDENVIQDLDENTSIRSLDATGSEIISVQGMEDGSFVEQVVASPNIMLNTKNTSMLLVAKQIVVDGQSYTLNQVFN